MLKKLVKCMTKPIEDSVCIFYSVTSSVKAGVNQTFSVTLLVAMVHLVVSEALLFNIFTRALYKIMQRDIFLFQSSLIPHV